MSAQQYRSLAVRWRGLAADATTARARNHLLTLARQCEFLADGGIGAQLSADNQQCGTWFGATE